MAKAPVAAENAPVAQPKKSKKKLILIVVVILVVLIGGGGAAFFMLSHKPKDENQAEEHKTAEPLAPPVFVVMDPFVVNLAEPDTSRYLQVGITYEVKDAPVAEEIKSLTPVIRSRILMVLSSKNVSDLNQVAGKQRLMDELVDLARVTIKEKDDKNDKDNTKGIRDVHFSSFVIQ